MSVHSQSLYNDAGIHQSGDASVVIAYTEWNDLIVRELVAGCEKKLAQYGVKKIEKIQVPGAFELVFACRRYYEVNKDGTNRPDVIIAFGCVIRGGTPHFEYICKAVTTGITGLNLSLPVPVVFGVLTVDTLEQARERAGGTHGHKGEEAAITALKMVAFNRGLNNPG